MESGPGRFAACGRIMSALPLRAPCAPCACAFRFRPRPAWRFAPFSPTSASASISGGRRNRSFQCLPIAAVGRPDEAPPLLPLLGPVSASSAESLSRALARSLVLAFLASKARSLFAVKATVELLLQCYAAGMSVDEVQVEVSGLALASGGVLSPLDTEVLTSWAAVVFLTARSCGASRGDLLSHFLGPDSEAARAGLEAGDAPAAADDPRAAGLAGFVDHTLQRWRAGDESLALMAARDRLSASGEGFSQAAEFMRQSARLVMLTAEMLAHLGVSEGPLPSPSNEAAGQDGAGEGAEVDGDELPAAGQPVDTRPVGVLPWRSSLAADALRARWGPLASPTSEGMPIDAESGDARGTAAAMLLCFMGAVLGSQYSLRAFARIGTYAYVAGWSARGIFSLLSAADFEQAGGLLPVASPALTTAAGAAAGEGDPQLPCGAMATAVAVDAQLLAQWLGVCFVALAEMAVPRPAQGGEEGWAWVMADRTEGSFEALSVADFVVRVLSQVLRERGLGVDAMPLSESPQGNAEGQSDADGVGGGRTDADAEVLPQSIADPFMEAESPSLALMRAQGLLVEMVVDEVVTLVACKDEWEQAAP